MLVEADGVVESLGGLFLRIHESQLAAQALQAAQTFQQAGAPQPQALVFGRGGHRLVVGGAGGIVVPDGAEGGDRAIGGGGDDIQVAAVERAALNIAVPLPALVLFIRLAGVEAAPGCPAARGQLLRAAQRADGETGRDGGIRNGAGKQAAVLGFPILGKDIPALP